jgi:hypothetical protein
MLINKKSSEILIIGGDKLSKEKRPVTYQQTLGSEIQRAQQLPEGYDISAFLDGADDDVSAVNPTSEEYKLHRKETNS